MGLSAYQNDVINAKICPYCKSETKVITETEVYGKTYKGRAIISCKNFPLCDSYVGTHDSGETLGRLASKALRKAKKDAHYWFDKIWKEGLEKRSCLYTRLSEYLDIPTEYTHIGMFSIKTCEKTKIWAKSMYEELLSEPKTIEQ